MWHKTQRFSRTAAGLDLTMEVRGTIEVLPWILGFGEMARVVQPQGLKDAVVATCRAALKAHDG